MAEFPAFSTLDELLGLMDATSATMQEDMASEDVPDEAEADENAAVRLTADQEQRLLRQVQEHYIEATTHRETMTQQRETNYRRFLSDPSTRDRRQLWEHTKAIFLPMTRSTVEDLQTRHSKQIGSLDALKIGGIGEEDVDAARKKELTMRYALSEINPTHWTHLVRDTQQDALIDKLGVLKVYPYAFPFPVATEGGQLLAQYIRMDAVDLGTMGIPPQATGLQWPECPYLFHQLPITVQEFPGMRTRGFALPSQEVLTRWLESGGQTTPMQDDPRLLLEFQRAGWDPSAITAGTIEMVESYELFNLGGEQDEFLVVSWFPKLGELGADGPAQWQAGKISRVKRLRDIFHQTVFARPMWPFFPIRCWRQPRSLWGMSAVERLEQEQDLLNRSAEQMIEEGDFNIAPRVFANLAATGDLPNLRHTEPGEVIPVDAMGQVWFAPQSNQNRHYIERMGLIRSWAEENMKVTAMSQGRTALQPNAPRTLGGQQLQLQEGDESHASQVTSLVLDYTPALKFYVGLWQQRFPDTMRVPSAPSAMQTVGQRLYGGTPTATTQLETVRHADLQGMFDLQIRVNPHALLDQQKMLTMAEHLDKLIVGKWPLGRRRLWKEVWEGLELKGFDDLYPEEVAVVETLLVVLQAQATIGQLEMGLMQLGQQPGVIQLPGGGFALPEPPPEPGFTTAPPGQPGQAAPPLPGAGLPGMAMPGGAGAMPAAMPTGDMGQILASLSQLLGGGARGR